jgi:hypothetical protein
MNLPAFAPYGILPASPGTAHSAMHWSSLLRVPTRRAGPRRSWHWMYYLPEVGSNGHELDMKKENLFGGERGASGSWYDRPGHNRAQ